MGNHISKKAGKRALQDVKNSANQQQKLEKEKQQQQQLKKKQHDEDAAATAAKPMSRKASAAEVQNNQFTHFVPAERLAKMLADITLKEEGINGITETSFIKYLFPHHIELGKGLYQFFYHASKSTSNCIALSAFKQQSEKFLSLMNDQMILENYVRMFAEKKEENEITSYDLRELLIVSYRLAMAGTGGGTCLQLLNTLSAILTSCFHGKDSLSVSYVSNWLWQHCPRIVQGVHRYVVHVFTTAYRNETLMANDNSEPLLVPSTPVLDQPDSVDASEALLPISHVWILAATLPFCYTKIEDDQQDKDTSMQALITKMSGTVCPRHWTLLYNSNQHGSGSNRFMHHVLGYKGPTLFFIRGVGETDDRRLYPTYCICSAVEWRESHLYWGNEDSMVIELLPNFHVVERGCKLLYLNTSIRGYPQGLRAGADPRNPCVIVDQSFQEVTFAGVPYRISSFEVWGCGDTKSRERQLEIKKWQVKEAEKQRVVKLSAAEWMDHPDRYLLELAGRPCYNTNNN